MLPPLRQRLVLLIVLALGGAAWGLAAPVLVPRNSTGISLFHGPLAWPLAVGLLVLAGLPAIAGGILASHTGHVLSGVFAAAVALAVPAWWGGPIDGWLRRAPLPGGYATLVLETCLWQAVLGGILVAVQRVRHPIRSRLPALLLGEVPGLDPPPAHPHLATLCAAAVCVLLALPITWLFIHSSDAPQVMWSVCGAFVVGGVIAHGAFPRANPVGVLFAPAVVASIAYTWVLTRYPGETDLLAAWFEGRLPGSALALPIHYASAGVAGGALGIGWAERLRAGAAETEA